VELAGSKVVEELEFCSVSAFEELDATLLWLSNEVGELSSPQAAKSEAERIAPVKAKEMREILCIA
jgi:hypothetical protein